MECFLKIKGFWLVQKLGLAKLIRASDWIILLYDANNTFQEGFRFEPIWLLYFKIKILDQSETRISIFECKLSNEQVFWCNFEESES